MLKPIPHPRLVRLIIDGTWADYTRVNKSLFDKNKTTTEGLTVAGVTFYGDIRDLGVDLLEIVEPESEIAESCKCRLYVDLLPRVQRNDGYREPDEEVDVVTREIGKDLPIIREYNAEVLAALRKEKNGK